jgi:hypothetical protein
MTKKKGDKFTYRKAHTVQAPHVAPTGRVLKGAKELLGAAQAQVQVLTEELAGYRRKEGEGLALATQLSNVRVENVELARENARLIDRCDKLEAADSQKATDREKKLEREVAKLNKQRDVLIQSLQVNLLAIEATLP